MIEINGVLGHDSTLQCHTGPGITWANEKAMRICPSSNRVTMCVLTIIMTVITIMPKNPCYRTLLFCVRAHYSVVYQSFSCIYDNG